MRVCCVFGPANFVQCHVGKNKTTKTIFTDFGLHICSCKINKLTEILGKIIFIILFLYPSKNYLLGTERTLNLRYCSNFGCSIEIAKPFAKKSLYLSYIYIYILITS